MPQWCLGNMWIEIAPKWCSSFLACRSSAALLQADTADSLIWSLMSPMAVINSSVPHLCQWLSRNHLDLHSSTKVKNKLACDDNNYHDNNNYDLKIYMYFTFNHWFKPWKYVYPVVLLFDLSWFLVGLSSRVHEADKRCNIQLFICVSGVKLRCVFLLG